jgi:alpha-beta hydrolase superfamily lysophospholipase
VRWSAAAPARIGSFWDPPNPLPHAPAGKLIRAEQVVGVPGVPAGATLWRILYHSRDVADRDVAVSGYAIVPGGPVSTGGRPVVTWAHGTTGTARACAPSLLSTSSDYGIYLTPDLGGLLSAGYVVAATDYQGLGAPGIHPYLVGAAEGQDVLDAARAARQLPHSDTSDKVVIMGHSEGGQAALYAGQLAKTYSPELDVVGTVAIAPLTETALALPLAEQFGDTPLLALAAYAWAHTYPDLPMSALFTPAVINALDRLASTECENTFANSLADSLPAAHLFRQGFAQGAAIRRYLAANSPGAVHTQSPVLVLQGTADTTIPEILAKTFESTQCPKVHDNLELRLYPGATHGSILDASAPYMLRWIADRVSGVTSAATGCSVTNG